MNIGMIGKQYENIDKKNFTDLVISQKKKLVKKLGKNKVSGPQSRKTESKIFL